MSSCRSITLCSNSLMRIEPLNPHDPPTAEPPLGILLVMEDDSALEYIQYIQSIANRVQFIERKLKKHVTQMCNLVTELELPDAAYQNESTGNHLKDIYWSLKLHLLFHLGEEAATKHPELNDLGSRLQLTEEQLAHLPDETSARDPGSIFLKIVSDQEESPEAPIGGKVHADKVLTRAAKAFNDYLPGSRNLFKPKVLSKVSCDGIWRVGSSVAVSNFLRPIYLHNKIFAFQENLLKAIILPGDDGVRDSQDSRWEAMAFAVKGGLNERDYDLPSPLLNVKPPCDNCRKIFGRLKGFISSGPTFLGACAEYYPVNSLLPDDPVTLREQVLIGCKKQSHREQCRQLFLEYRKIADSCKKAYRRYVDFKETKHLQAVYKNILPTLFIFGYDPDCGL
ncbi:uncharacterized protein [Montipora foliosa]|uniref:uncharacterized protein isoform X1 n=1 Tax=Montipora foliosa TaxID=591990 RepID=UPI0035F14133